MSMNRRGYKTTEFWVSLSVTLVMLAKLTGYLPETVDEGETAEAVESVVVGAVALGSLCAYVWSRIKAKAG